MNKTVRQMIEGYRARLLSETLVANEASQILVELSALVGNVNEEIVDREMAYNRHLNNLLAMPNMSAAAAEIRARASDQYEVYQRTKGYLTLVTEMIRGLKYRLRSLEEEERLSKNL